ncbi:hypothetical protein BX600DRAFT_513868 [Xylariales sp. PMI_506]|nr:hypothetical protein BX600DRAFT_513868 [Xylariales sp. PMI_506]
MSTKTTGSLIVIGSGPGTGRAVAAHFAQKRYDNVALISRQAGRLDEDKSFIQAAAARPLNVKTYAIDITDEEVYASTLKKIETEFGTPETVFFNAARVQGSELLKISSEEVEQELKINSIALYNTARWLLPQMISLGKSNPSARPSLIVANSFLASAPIAALFSLSMAKAAQRNLVQSLAQAFEGQGVHIGFVTIGGIISPDKNNMSPKNIAREIYDFFASDEKKTNVELEIKDD